RAFYDRGRFPRLVSAIGFIRRCCARRSEMQKAILVLGSSILVACSSAGSTDTQDNPPPASANDSGSVVPPTAEGGTVPTEDAGQQTPDSATPADAGPPDEPDAGTLIWPNDVSSANSDPWIAEHHDEITEMRPRALILHFANGKSVNDVTTRWN